MTWPQLRPAFPRPQTRARPGPSPLRRVGRRRRRRGRAARKRTTCRTWCLTRAAATMMMTRARRRRAPAPRAPPPSPARSSRGSSAVRRAQGAALRWRGGVVVSAIAKLACSTLRVRRGMQAQALLAVSAPSAAAEPTRTTKIPGLADMPWLPLVKLSCAGFLNKEEAAARRSARSSTSYSGAGGHWVWAVCVCALCIGFACVALQAVLRRRSARLPLLAARLLPALCPAPPPASATAGRAAAATPPPSPPCRPAGAGQREDLRGPGAPRAGSAAEPQRGGQAAFEEEMEEEEGSENEDEVGG